MRRTALIVLVLFVASSASAGWYMGMGLAGTAGYEIAFDYYGRDAISPGDNDGVIDNATMTFGYELEAMDLELTLGYGSSTVTYPDGESRGEEEKYSRYSLGLAGLYHLAKTEDYALDAGLRLALISNKYEYDGSARADEQKLSGWAVGPVFRARVFLADGKFAFGPEVFANYTSMTYTDDWNSWLDDTELSGLSLDYALRLDFLF